MDLAWLHQTEAAALARAASRGPAELLGSRSFNLL